MKKQATVEKTREAIAMVKAAGIQSFASFIIGYPGDTEETIQDTIQFAIELDLDDAQFSILVPFPGTELFEKAKRENAFRCDPDDFESFYWYYSVAANFTSLPDERLVELQKLAYERWQNRHNATDNLVPANMSSENIWFRSTTCE